MSCVSRRASVYGTEPLTFSLIVASLISTEKAATHGVPIIRGTDAYLSYPKHSAHAKGSHAFIGNGDSVAF